MAGTAMTGLEGLVSAEMLAQAPIPAALRRRIESNAAEELASSGEAQDESTAQPEAQPDAAMTPDAGVLSTSQPEAQPEAASKAASQDALLSDNAAFEQRYRILKGKYDAEVPNLAAQVRALRAELDALRAQAAVAPSGGSPSATRNAPITTHDVLAELKPEQREAFDPDLLDVIVQVANRSAQTAVEPFKAEFEQSAQSRFDTALTVAVPNWRQIDCDERWPAWLEERGGSRRAGLLEAYGRQDVDAVATYFEDFLTYLEAHRARAGAGNGNGTSAGPPRPSVASQVVPATAAGEGAPAARVEPRRYTFDEWRTAMSKATRNQTLPFDERLKQVNELQKAMDEGRVT